MMQTKPRPQRPRRAKKGDRLLASGALEAEIACDYMLGPLDTLAREMDRKWGVDRLPELVGVEMAERYGVAVAYLNKCIDAKDPEMARGAVENCLRGLRAMDDLATAERAPQATTAVFEIEVDGFRFGILQDDACWPAAEATHPHLKCFSKRQIANAIKAYASSLPVAQEIVDKFGPAKVTKVSTMAELDDEIPF